MHVAARENNVHPLSDQRAERIFGSLRADGGRGLDHGLAPAGDQHDIVGCKRQLRLDWQIRAIAPDLPDSQVAAVALLERGNREVRRRSDTEHPAYQRWRTQALAFFERAAPAEHAPHALRLVAQIDPQQKRRELARKEHDGNQAKQIADAVRRDDIGLQPHGLCAAETQLADCLGSRADHSRFGRRSRQQSGSSADVQPHHHHHDHHQHQHGDDFDNG